MVDTFGIAVFWLRNGQMGWIGEGCFPLNGQEGETTGDS